MIPFGCLIAVVCAASCEVFVLGERSKRAVHAGTPFVNKIFRLLDCSYLAYLQDVVFDQGARCHMDMSNALTLVGKCSIMAFLE